MVEVEKHIRRIPLKDMYLAHQTINRSMGDESIRQEIFLFERKIL